jgi:hypothetical protein
MAPVVANPTEKFRLNLLVLLCKLDRFVTVHYFSSMLVYLTQNVRKFTLNFLYIRLAP